MNDVWNLKPIYLDFEDPALEADIHELEGAVKELEIFSADPGVAGGIPGLRKGLLLQEKIAALGEKLALYASLRQAADTTDSRAGSMLGRVLGILSAEAAPSAAFAAWAAGLPELDSCISSDPLLEEYRFLLEDMRRTSRHLLPGIGEAVAARMRLSGGNAWTELQQYLTSTVQVPFRNETMGLAAVRNLAYDPDVLTRQEAFRAELACYPAICASVAFALNSVKLETISETQLRGYESPLDRTLQESHMSRKTLDAMLSAIQEYLPRFWKYLRTKAAALGHAGGLPWYDLFAPMGTEGTAFTPESTRAYLVNIFSDFDRSMADMIGRAFDEAWIDFYPRSGKEGGAFCAGVPDLGQSRILTNFGGRIGDAVTLAHELGHAFHNQCIADHRPLNRSYSMPVAETASTFNEVAAAAYAIDHAADDGEKLALVEMELQGVTQIVCDIYSRFLFEEEVFRRREQEFLNADTLCGIMLDAQRRAYGDGLDPECLHPYMWVCKSHYYGASFYNFPYAFGGLLARGLYAVYLQEGSAFTDRYKQLLHATPVASAEDAAALAGIDLTDRAFWCSALEIVSGRIDQFCALTAKDRHTQC